MFLESRSIILLLESQSTLIFPHYCLGILVIDAILLRNLVDTALVLQDCQLNQELLGGIVNFLVSSLLNRLEHTVLGCISSCLTVGARWAPYSFSHNKIINS